MRPLTLADAAELVRRNGHDPDTLAGAQRAMRLMCKPRPEEQLELFDGLLLARAQDAGRSTRDTAIGVSVR